MVTSERMVSAIFTAIWSTKEEVGELNSLVFVAISSLMISLWIESIQDTELYFYTEYMQHIHWLVRANPLP